MRRVLALCTLVAACQHPDRLREPSHSGEDAAQTEVVRTTQELNPGIIIEATHVELVRMPQTLVSPRAFHSLDEVVGRTLRHGLAEQELVTEPVLNRVLSDRVSSLIPIGRRAVSVPLNAALTVGGHADLWVARRGLGCTIAQLATVVAISDGRAELALLPDEAVRVLTGMYEPSFAVTARRDGDDLFRKELACSF